MFKSYTPNFGLSPALICFSALRSKRTDVVGQLKTLQAETDLITKIFEDQEVMRQMQSSR